MTQNKRAGRVDLLAMLHERYLEHQSLPPFIRESIDAARILPMSEMYDILFHFVVTGEFYDEVMLPGAQKPLPGKADRGFRVVLQDESSNEVDGGCPASKPNHRDDCNVPPGWLLKVVALPLHVSSR